ncbi:MAG: MoaD/ThiS family protein [Actinomycetota bacterium]|nr:MoaD/ThiS family protein [Actinomycetota bacterium]
MSVQVKIPAQLRPLLGGAAEVEASGDRVDRVLEDLGDRFPALVPRLLDDSGRLRRFVNLYVDDEDIRFLQGLETPVGPGARVSIIPAIAGG